VKGEKDAPLFNGREKVTRSGMLVSAWLSLSGAIMREAMASANFFRPL
jgi:hypothetical protein